MSNNSLSYSSSGANRFQAVRSLVLRLKLGLYIWRGHCLESCNDCCSAGLCRPHEQDTRMVGMGFMVSLRRHPCLLSSRKENLGVLCRLVDSQDPGHLTGILLLPLDRLLVLRAFYSAAIPSQLP